jgi:hypothetical protein
MVDAVANCLGDIEDYNRVTVPLTKPTFDDKVNEHANTCYISEERPSKRRASAHLARELAVELITGKSTLRGVFADQKAQCFDSGQMSRACIILLVGLQRYQDAILHIQSRLSDLPSQKSTT